VLKDAIELRASDITRTVEDMKLRIRYRIDGVLQDVPVPAQIKRFQPAIVSRVKILSHLNIAEKRLPQDGRIKFGLKTPRWTFVCRNSDAARRSGCDAFLRQIQRSVGWLKIGMDGPRTWRLRRVCKCRTALFRHRTDRQRQDIDALYRRMKITIRSQDNYD